MSSTQLITLPESKYQQHYAPNITLGEYTFPHEVVRKMISFSTPKEILKVWALISKEFHHITTTKHLWELVGHIFPPFKKREIHDFATYHHLSHAYQNINYIKDVTHLSYNLTEPSQFLGKLGKYFLFQKQNGHIAYYSFLLQKESLKEIKAISSIQELTCDTTITSACCSDDYLLVCYSDGTLKVYDSVEEGVKRLFRFIPAETINHDICMHHVEGFTFIVSTNCIFRVNEQGKEACKIIFMNYRNSLAVFTCYIKTPPMDKHAEIIKAFTKLNKELFLIGTAKNEVFIWNYKQPYAYQLLCTVDSSIRRIDCDYDHNPNYVVICTDESIFSIHVPTKKIVKIDLSGSVVLSISFQKNAFFVGDLYGNLYKCDVFSPIPICIYRAKRSQTQIVSFPQVWVGSSLCFSNDPLILRVIDFS